MKFLRSMSAALLFVLLFSVSAFGASMSLSDATRVVTGWLTLESSPFELGDRSVQRAESFDGMYYAVYLSPKGIVLIPADDELEPITAYLPDATDYEPKPESAVHKLVVSNMIRQIENIRSVAGGRGMSGAPEKWAMLAGVAAGGLRGAEFPGIDTIQEVVVQPLLKTEWDQGAVGSADNYVYNYYTPSHSLSGCTATATAQIMKFFEFPKVGIGVHSKMFRIEGDETTAATRGGDGSGGPYRWSLMPDKPYELGLLLTDDQRESIGALLYDAGISIKSNYQPASGGATSSFVHLAADALVDTFGYSNAIGTSYLNDDWSFGVPLDVFYSAVNSNLDAGLPVLIGAIGKLGGHAFASDGYGYNLGTMYHHMNLGWSGQENLWYNVPTVNDFNVIDEIAYNIYTEGSGEIASGRVFYDDGTPASGVKLALVGDSYSASAASGSDGRFAFAKLLSGRTYLITATADDYEGASVQIKTGHSVKSAYTSPRPTTGNLWNVELKEGVFHRETSSGGSSGCATGTGAFVALLIFAVIKRKY